MSILREKLCQKLGIRNDWSDLLQKVASIKDLYASRLEYTPDGVYHADIMTDNGENDVTRCYYHDDKDPFFAVAKALEMALGMDGGETKC